MTFAEKLEKALKAKNKNQNDLARYLGVPPGTVSTWKKRNSIGKTYLKQVAEFLGVTTDYLLDNDPMPVNINAPANIGVNNHLQVHHSPQLPPEVQTIVNIVIDLPKEKQLEIIKCLYKNCIE